MWMLVVARAVQGFGAGLNIVALYVVVARAFPEQLRPRVFSAMSSGWILPSLVGPPVAGFLADQASWRWVFLGVLPLLAAPRCSSHRGWDGSAAARPAGPGGAARRLPAAAGAGLLQLGGSCSTEPGVRRRSSWRCCCEFPGCCPPAPSGSDAACRRSSCCVA